MKKTISQIPTDQLVVGQVTAEAVVDAGGRVLLPAGSELTESSLNGLRRRGIETVAVEFVSAADPAEQAVRREHLVAELDHRFRQAGSGQETRTLYAEILAYSLEHRS